MGKLIPSELEVLNEYYAQQRSYLNMGAHFYATPVQNDSTYGVEYNIMIDRKSATDTVQNFHIHQDWSNYSSYSPIIYEGNLFINNNASRFAAANLPDIFATTVSTPFEGYDASSRNGSMFFVIGKLWDEATNPTFFSNTIVDTTFKAGTLISHNHGFYKNQRGTKLDLMFDPTNNKIKYGLVSASPYTNHFIESSVVDHDNASPFIVYVELENNNVLRIYHNNMKIMDYTYTAKPHVFWFFDEAETHKIRGSTGIQFFGSGAVGTNGSSGLGGLVGYLGDLVGFTRVLSESERTEVYNGLVSKYNI